MPAPGFAYPCEAELSGCFLTLSSFIFLCLLIIYLSIYLSITYLLFITFKCKLGGFSLNIWSFIVLEVEDHALVLVQSVPYVVLTALCKPGTKGKSNIFDLYASRKNLQNSAPRWYFLGIKKRKGINPNVFLPLCILFSYTRFIQSLEQLHRIVIITLIL